MRVLLDRTGVPGEGDARRRFDRGRVREGYSNAGRGVCVRVYDMNVGRGGDDNVCE